MFEKIKKVYDSNIFKNITALMILQAANYLLPLIIMPYMIRVLGIANFGIFSLAQAISLYLAIITDYGFSFSAAKMTSINRNNKVKLSNIFHSVLCVKILLLVGVIVIYFFCVSWLNRLSENKLVYIYSIGILIGQTIIPVWFFQGMEKMKYITIVNVLIRLIFMVFLVLFISEPKHLELAVLFQSLSFLFASFVSIFFAYRYFNLKFCLPKRKDIMQLIGEGKHMYISTLSISLYRNANILILGFFANDVAVGVYSSAEKVVRAIQSITSPVSQAIYPSLSFKFSKISVLEALTNIWKVAKYYTIVLVFIVIVSILLEPVIEEILNVNNSSFRVTFYFLCPLILFGSLNYLLGIVGLVNLNKEKLFSRITLVGGLVNVILSLFLVDTYSEKGVAFSLLISELLITFIIVYVLIKLNIKEKHLIEND